MNNTTLTTQTTPGLSKETLCQILNVTLLAYDGVGGDELEKYGIEPSNIKIGIKLLKFLQEKLKWFKDINSNHIAEILTAQIAWRL